MCSIIYFIKVGTEYESLFINDGHLLLFNLAFDMFPNLKYNSLHRYELLCKPVWLIISVVLLISNLDANRLFSCFISPASCSSSPSPAGMNEVLKGHITV